MVPPSATGAAEVCGDRRRRREPESVLPNSLIAVTAASFDVVAFLNEVRRPAQVASVSKSRQPLLGSLWFLFERRRFWFSSAKAAVLPSAAQRGAPVAVIIDDFDPPTSIRQVRVRGRGQIEPHDPAVVSRIYDDWVLWSVCPDTGLALTAPDFLEDPYRWADLGHSPFV